MVFVCMKVVKGELNIVKSGCEKSFTISTEIMSLYFDVNLKFLVGFRKMGDLVTSAVGLKYPGLIFYHSQGL